ncbi:MAG: DUF502 domain-containing protein [Parachlamydiaceae bacterium]|nr:DUF502 domain-containing protein [Parachlamydiaceae bacterium]
MKKYFITGLVILLPLALTFAVVAFVFNLLTEPFVGLFKAIFNYFGLFTSGFLFFSTDQFQKYISQLMILTLLFFSTVGLGLIARWFFVHYFIRGWERILYKIPFISSIYKTCRDVITTLFTSDTNSFKQVVMVPFPSKETMAIGFITRENLPSVNEHKASMIAIYVPTTPNPTSGFLVMYHEEDIIFMDMKVEDALKYVISCGVIATPFTVLSKEERLNRRIEPNEQLADKT